MIAYFVTVLCLVVSALGYPEHPKQSLDGYPFPFISQEAWGANPPVFVTRLNTPVTYVVIHHTYIPGLCLTRELCMQHMQSMQNAHQFTNGWSDIGYNFAVGGEGSVYEGRGWEVVGTHAAGVNSRSIAIALIGDFVSQLPPAIVLQATKQLISEGVKRGFIRPDYKLIGHRQVTATECPGEALFQEIRTWDHFSNEDIRAQLSPVIALQNARQLMSEGVKSDIIRPDNQDLFADPETEGRKTTIHDKKIPKKTEEQDYYHIKN